MDDKDKQLIFEKTNGICHICSDVISNDPEEMVSEKAKELALRKQYYIN